MKEFKMSGEARLLDTSGRLRPEIPQCIFKVRGRGGAKSNLRIQLIDSEYFAAF